jgi:hypothetical protein
MADENVIPFGRGHGNELRVVEDEGWEVSEQWVVMV